MSDQALERLIAVGDALFGKRGATEGMWQELADHFYPERGEFSRSISEGETFADWLYDSTAVLFRRELANNLPSILRPPQSPWFKVRTGNTHTDNKPENLTWLDRTTSIHRRHYYRAKSGIVESMKQGDHDFTTFGNTVISTLARPGNAYLTQRCHHLKDVVWLDNDDGETDHVQFRRKMAARDIVKRWPKTVPKRIREANEKDGTTEFMLRRIICPCEEYYGETGRRGKKRQPFVSIWATLDGERTLLEATPLAEMPVAIPRWHMLSGSQYAISPSALVALPDARMIQSLKRIILEAGEKAVDPPLIATEDAVQGGINIQSGGVTWVDAEYNEKMGSALRALELGKNPMLGAEMLQDVRATLSEAWYINKLSLPATGDMTAYEAQQRIKEYVRSAMPLFEPFGPSYSSKVLDIQFRILLRLGEFGPVDEIPKDLQGAEIEFDYETPLQEAEGRAKVIAFGEVTQIVGAASAMDKSVGRNLDLNKATRDAVAGTGAPGGWLVDEDDLAEQGEEGPGVDEVGAIAGVAKDGSQAVKNLAEAQAAAQGVRV